MTRPTTAEQKEFELLKALEKGPMFPGALARSLKCHPNSLTPRLNHALALGYIEHNWGRRGHSRISITAAGIARLKEVQNDGKT